MRLMTDYQIHCFGDDFVAFRQQKLSVSPSA